MAVLQTVGIVAALAVVALMALGPTLVDLNDRFPPRQADPKPRESHAHRPTLTRQPAHHH